MLALIYQINKAVDEIDYRARPRHQMNPGYMGYMGPPPAQQMYPVRGQPPPNTHFGGQGVAIGGGYVPENAPLSDRPEPVPFKPAVDDRQRAK